MNTLWKKWTINCALGELVGIACAGSIAYFVNVMVGDSQALGAKIITLGAMLIAGFIEGSVLAYFQWKVLVTKFTKVTKREWFFYTVMVAVLGWFLGMLPSLFMMPETVNSDSTQPEMNYSNPLVFALLSIAMGLILGAVFGLFQWFSLRRHARKAYKWIIANALGWGLGLGWIYLFASIPDENSNIFFIALVGICGGILAGLSVGAVTGFYLVNLDVKDNGDIL